MYDKGTLQITKGLAAIYGKWIAAVFWLSATPVSGKRSRPPGNENSSYVFLSTVPNREGSEVLRVFRSDSARIPQGTVYETDFSCSIQHVVSLCRGESAIHRGRR
jgi:hypothetical protein